MEKSYRNSLGGDDHGLSLGGVLQQPPRPEAPSTVGQCERRTASAGAGGSRTTLGLGRVGGAPAALPHGKTTGGSPPLVPASVCCSADSPNAPLAPSAGSQGLPGMRGWGGPGLGPGQRWQVTSINMSLYEFIIVETTWTMSSRLSQ